MAWLQAQQQWQGWMAAVRAALEWPSEKGSRLCLSPGERVHTNLQTRLNLRFFLDLLRRRVICTVEEVEEVRVSRSML